MSDPNQYGGGGWGQQPQQGQQQGWGQPAQQGWQQGAAPPPAGGQPFLEAKNANYPLTEDAKQAAFYAHLFGALAAIIFCGTLLNAAAPLLAMALYKENPKSPFAMYHINQAFIFQGVIVVATIIGYVLWYILMIVTCGIGAFIPVFIIPPLVGLIYGLVVAFKVKNGEWAGYAVIGEKVLATKSPMFK